MQDIDFANFMETVALDLRGRPSSKHGNEWRYCTNGSLSIDIKRGTFFNHAWSAEKRKIEGGKSDFSQRKADLARLGDEPEKPLEPNLLSESSTVEGLAKNWPGMHASLGIFSTEGSMFTASLTCER